MSEQDKDKHDGGHGNQSRFIQHHYDDAHHQFESGKLGIWLFLVQEVLFFSALFVAYILYRHHRPEIYAYAHYYLDVKMGAINTAVLIFSSLTAAWAVRCAQLGQRKGLILCLSLTILCACAFLGIKYQEYSHKVHEGILFGRYFDPCVSSGGGELVTKGNLCEGSKSSVLYDRSAIYDDADVAIAKDRLKAQHRKEADAGGLVFKPNPDEVAKIPGGCLVASEIDLDVNRTGIQAVCKVEEVKFTASRNAKGDLVRTEGAVREIEACEEEPEGHGAKQGAKPKKFPCWEFSSNPNICPTGPAVLVAYGDKEKHPGVLIKPTCDYPKPMVMGDVYADPTAPVVELGSIEVNRERVKTKHEMQHEFSMGPPPPHTNMFFSIYFAMTGLHGIHVLAGILVFSWLLRRAIRGDFTPDYFGPIDYAALYWHIVDLIWIFLFPLLYLIH
jgi:cytochrome c oxidase subunit III